MWFIYFYCYVSCSPILTDGKSFLPLRLLVHRVVYVVTWFKRSFNIVFDTYFTNIVVSRNYSSLLLINSQFKFPSKLKSMDLFSDESTDQKDWFCSGYRPRERILRIIDAGNEQQSRTTTSTTSTTTYQRWGKF